MSDRALVLKAETEKANRLVYNVKTSVHVQNSGDSSLELIRFVLDTTRNADGFFPAYVLDAEYRPLSSKIYEFSTIEEFFALAAFIVRNGIVRNC